MKLDSILLSDRVFSSDRYKSKHSFASVDCLGIDTPAKSDNFLLTLKINETKNDKILNATSKIDNVNYILKYGTQAKENLFLHDYHMLQHLSTIKEMVPYIPKCRDPIPFANNLYTIYEKPDGCTLHEMLSAYGVPTQPVVRYLFSNILRAVSILHSNSIAHRNLTLDNIIVSCSKHTISICNYEYATKDCKVHTDEKCGSAEYFCPKALLYYPKEKDSYSLGVLLFLLSLGMKITQNIEKKVAYHSESLQFINNKWSNRKNWKILQKMLRSNNTSPDETTALKDVLLNLLSRSADARQSPINVLSTLWITDFHTASSKELDDYFKNEQK